MTTGVVYRMITLWWSRVDHDVAAVSRPLSEGERRHVASIVDLPTRMSQAHSYVMRRHVLGRRLGLEPGAIKFKRRCTRCGSLSHGRPSLANEDARAISFSVSHSATHVVVAVADVPLGVDVEVQRSNEVWAEVRPLVSHPRDRVCSDLHRWTGKEAALKLLGVGLAHPMAEVCLEGCRWRAGLPLEPSTGYVTWHPLGGRVLASVASMTTARVEARRWP
ncbi:MAG: hypothetical protein M3540_13045 [Actinomycetota bacterium]|nr:hypothetical protein [Actinomycetota bacterium]